MKCSRTAPSETKPSDPPRPCWDSTWAGKETTKGTLTGKAWLEIGSSSAIEVLGSILGIKPKLLAQYGISRDKAEEILADLNYALVRLAYDEAMARATITGKFDEDVFREEFHQELSDLYTRYESWAAGRREDQYGADHLVGDIRDSLSYMKKETGELLKGLMDGIKAGAEDAKRGIKEGTEDVSKGITDALS